MRTFLIMIKVEIQPLGYIKGLCTVCQYAL